MIIVGATGTGVGIAFDNRRVVDAGKYHRVTLHKTNMCGRELLPKITPTKNLDILTRSILLSSTAT